MKKIHKIILISVSLIFIFVTVFAHAWLLTPRSFSKLIDGREIVGVEFVLENMLNGFYSDEFYKYSMTPENDKFSGCVSFFNQFEYFLDLGHTDLWINKCRIKFSDGSSIVIFMEHIVEFNANNDRIRRINIKNTEVKLYSLKEFMIWHGNVTPIPIDDYNESI